MFRKDFELLNEAYNQKINEFTGSMGIPGNNSAGAGLNTDRLQSVKLPQKGQKVLITTPINKPGTQTPQGATITPVEGEEANKICAAKGGNCICSGCPACIANQKNVRLQPQQSVQSGEDCEECGGACGVEREDTDSDTYMAKQLVYRIFKLSTMIYSLLAKGGCDAKVEAWVLDKISKAHDNLNSVFGYKDFEDFKKSIQSMGGLYEETEIDLYNAFNNGGDNLIAAIKGILSKESKETKQQVFAEVIKLLDS
jgi:hypothetical protein